MNDSFALLAVGGGPAGLASVRGFREAGGAGSVAIITDEHRMPYSRPPLTKELLRGHIGADELPLEPESWLTDNDVHLISGRAVDLDPDARLLTLSGGRDLEYDSCVLATGAEPKRLPIPGADDPGVRVLRSLDHLRELEARLDASGRVVVIGSGFIGCEIAASLRLRDHPVTLISDEAQPNAARLGERAGQQIASWLEEYGVELQLDRPVEAIERAGDALHVAGVAAHIVIMASGVAPRGELATRAGIELSDGAIPVDASMRTTLPGVLAAGDACRAYNSAAGRPLHVEHWGEALAHGEIAGRTAAGAHAEWDAVPGFWSTIGDRVLKYAAWGDGYDAEHFQDHSGGTFSVSYGRDGKLVGVLTHEADEDYENGGEQIGRGAPWPY